MPTRLLGIARRVYWIDVLYRAGEDFSRQQGFIYAAAISYYVVLSLFPLLILLTMVFGWIAQVTGVQADVVDTLVEQLPANLQDDLRPVVEQIVADVSTRFGLFGLFGLFGTVWTASNMFGALRRALNAAFNVPQGRPYFVGRLLDLLSILGVVLVALLSIVATAGLGILRAASTDVFESTLLNLIWGVVFFLLPLAISFVAFVMVFRLIPNVRVSIRELRVGALLAALGFELVKVGFTVYVANFGRYQEVYGTLAGFVAFLFFIFLESSIVIFAASVVSELWKDRHPRLPAPKPEHLPAPTGRESS